MTQESYLSASEKSRLSKNWDWVDPKYRKYKPISNFMSF